MSNYVHEYYHIFKTFHTFIAKQGTVQLSDTVNETVTAPTSLIVCITLIRIRCNVQCIYLKTLKTLLYVGSWWWNVYLTWLKVILNSKNSLKQCLPFHKSNPSENSNAGKQKCVWPESQYWDRHLLFITCLRVSISSHKSPHFFHHDNDYNNRWLIIWYI